MVKQVFGLAAETQVVVPPDVNKKYPFAHWVGIGAVRLPFSSGP